MTPSSSTPSVRTVSEQDTQEKDKHHHQFRCAHCNASFKRSEHLKRHQTQHSKNKAFACQYCNKKFARSDVLHRHYSSCKAMKASNAIPVRPAGNPKRACSPCRTSKVKCTGQGSVCDRCKNIGLDASCAPHQPLRRRRPRLLSQSQAVPAIGGEIVEAAPVQSTVSQHTAEELSAALGLNDFRAAEERQQVGSEMLSSTVVVPPLFEDFQSQPGQSQAVNMSAENMSPSAIPAIDASGPLDANTNQHCATQFTLDALDYSMIDVLFNSQHSTYDIDYTSPDWGMDDQCHATSFDDSSYGIDASLQIPNQHANWLPKGMNIMQISPLETHRLRILDHLKNIGQCNRERLAWFSADNVNIFLWSYFTHCHHHTPFLHLPSWNIGLASTRLVFALLLMGAMYSGDLKLYGSYSRKLCSLAEEYAWATDPASEKDPSCTLDTIQAVYLLNLLDAFFFRSPGQKPTLNHQRLVNAARATGLFDSATYTSESGSISWLQWSNQESRLRTAFIIYLFDAIRAILFGHRPELRLYELQLPLPSYESAFAAGDEGTWLLAWQHAAGLTKLEYSLILSAVLSNRLPEHDLHFSVMGSFIVLHGILLHLWERQQMFTFPRRCLGTEAADRGLREELAAAHQDVTTKALRFWRTQWNKTLESPDAASSSGLYRDRALVYWVLATLVNQPHYAGATKLSPYSESDSSVWTMRVPRLVSRLVTMLERNPKQVDNVDLATEFPSDEDEDIAEAQVGEAEKNMNTISINFLLRKSQIARNDVQ